MKTNYLQSSTKGEKPLKWYSMKKEQKKTIKEIYRDILIPYFINTAMSCDYPDNKFWDIRPPVLEYDILNHGFCGKDCWEKDRIIDLR